MSAISAASRWPVAVAAGGARARARATTSAASHHQRRCFHSCFLLPSRRGRRPLPLLLRPGHTNTQNRLLQRIVSSNPCTLTSCRSFAIRAIIRHRHHHHHGLLPYYQTSYSASSPRMILTTLLAGCYCTTNALFTSYYNRDKTAADVVHCEALAVGVPPVQDEFSSLRDDDTDICQDLHHVPWSEQSLGQKLKRAWRLLKRVIQLGINLGPAGTLYYPLMYLTSKRNNDDEQEAPMDAHILMLQHDDDDNDQKTHPIRRWYLKFCLRSVERSGAAVIKLLQWAGSRPDLFGHDFCTVFSKLQDDTTPHSWHHTEQLLRESLGNDWQEDLELHEILGSGCIGQVYRGTIVVNHQHQSHEEKTVAVKILHPNVREDIDADLDILRVAVRAVQYLPGMSSLRWLNMEGVVEEFAELLKLQLDLRREAANLERFQINFKHEPAVEFPQLVSGFVPTEKVLVETFCEGIPVMQYCRENQDRQEALTDLCRKAIRGVCQMIFLDNFVHGDLHPGNVFVSPDGKKFVLFDVGIVNEYTDDDHAAIVDILSAFVRKQGRIAGRRMIDDSNVRLRHSGTEDAAQKEEIFLDKIEHLTIQANTQGYFMEHLGTYISYICDAAATHHVMLNESFVTAALAVKIQEGIALAMDPAVKIPKVAIPIIIESERRRYTKSATNDVSSAAEQLKKTIFGSSEQENKKQQQ